MSHFLILNTCTFEKNGSAFLQLRNEKISGYFYKWGGFVIRLFYFTYFISQDCIRIKWQKPQGLPR